MRYLKLLCATLIAAAVTALAIGTAVSMPSKPSNPLSGDRMATGNMEFSKPAAQTNDCYRIHLPLVVKNHSLAPVPSPTPASLFGDRPDACYSPDGRVPPDCRIYSPDGQRYVMELAGANGQFGVFNLCTRAQLNTFTGDAYNDLKGMAFSPNSAQVALMYHYNHISNTVQLIDDLYGTPTKTYLPIGSTYYHYMVYLTEACLAFSLSPSEDEAVVYCIEGTSCTLAQWRANGGVCPP